MRLGLDWIRGRIERLFAREGQACAHPVEVSTPGKKKPAARPAAPKRGRPVSESLSRTVEKLRTHPDITPAELAEQLKVSRDYARTLLRRARARIEETAPAPAAPVPISRLRRLALEPARQTAVALPAQSLNLNRRMQVLRRAQAGESQQAIAAAVGIPAGEVEFILKVDRILSAAF